MGRVTLSMFCLSNHRFPLDIEIVPIYLKDTYWKMRNSSWMTVLLQYSC